MRLLLALWLALLINQVSAFLGNARSRFHIPILGRTKLENTGVESLYASTQILARSVSSDLSGVAKFAIGQQVVGKVDDSDDKTVTFLVNGRKALLSTNNLTWQERMTLQVGAMMQLFVSDIDGESLHVSLQPSSTGSATSGSPEPLLKNLASTFGETSAKKSRISKPVAPPKIIPFDTSGILLNNLKTGMKLEGTVHSCTSYAAFVTAGVQRAGKGGNFKIENGMLHKSDIPKHMLPKGAGHGTSKPLLEAGSRVTVYVKEVFKNSGRFSVTMDPNFDKAQVLEEKMQIKEEGRERRRARRLRRVLETVTVGDTVSGVVDSVVPEGVLVTVTSLGPLNVTGLLMKRELPKQFTVPPDLKESFQAQLLTQDFAKGRPISCGVLAVNTKPSLAASDFNMKLLFEEFGAMPEDDLKIVDKMDARKEGLPKGLEDRDDEDEDEDELQSSDVREIYNELRGNKPLMLVQDLYDWADIQDMLQEGDIDEKTIQKALQEVGVPSTKEVKFTQFQEIVEILQDAMDGVSSDTLKNYEQDEDEDELSEEEVQSLPPLPAKLQPITMTKDDSKASKKSAPVAKQTKQEVDEEGASVAMNDEDMDSMEDEAIEEVAQEIFDELRGKSKTLSVKAFREWSDIKDLEKNELIDQEAIKEALEEVGAKKDLSFDQFFEVVQILEDVAAENGMDYEEEDENEGDDEDDYFEIDEAEEEAMLQEIFDKLKNKAGKVTSAAFKKWDELASMELSTEEIEAAMTKAGVTAKGSISFEQFVALVRTLDEAEEVEVEEEEDENDTVDEELEIDFDDEKMTPEENEEMLKMLFDTLRGNKKTVSMKTFMAWDDVQDMLKEGVLDQETLNIFVSEVGLKKGADLTQEQFIALVTMLDENMRAMAEGDNDAGMEEKDDDEPNFDSEELEAVAQEIFDELRGKSKALPIKSFRKWEEVQEALKAGILSENTLDVLIREVAAPKSTELSFDEFKQLVELLDQVADAAMGASSEDTSIESKALPGSAAKKAGSAAAAKVSQAIDEDEDDDMVYEVDEEGEPTPEQLEAFAREIFDELKSAKSNKVTVKAFKAWEGVQEVIESGELSKEDLNAVISEVDRDNTGSLTFAQFRDVMDKIEEVLDDSEEEDEEEEEELDAVATWGKAAAPVAKGKAAAAAGGQGFSREGDKPKPKTSPKTSAAAPAASETLDEALEVATEIFDELRGKKKTLSVKTFKAWEDTRDLIDSGALKRSTLEQAIRKVGALESGEMTLEQFVALVDIIQVSIDESNLSLEEEEDDDAARIPTSKGSKVLRVSGDEPDELDGDDDTDWDGEGMEEELSEEEQARLVYDELRGAKKVVPLVDFLKWEDVQELLECGALSKDNLATAIENAGLTVDKGDLTFEAVSPHLAYSH